MAKSVFEKKHGEDDALTDVSGVLDQFNLPPAFIEFVRKNKRSIQLVLIVVIVLVVFFSLYGSYREEKIDNAAQALSLAIIETDAMKTDALQRIIDDFSSTPSAQWATVEMAHEKMKEGAFEEAAVLYEQVASEVGENNPMYNLTLLGLAQADEKGGKLDEALTKYESLKLKPGYEGLGFSGAGRIYEKKNDLQKALEIYQLYAAELTQFPDNYPEKILLNEKIARLKSVM